MILRRTQPATTDIYRSSWSVVVVVVVEKVTSTECLTIRGVKTCEGAKSVVVRSLFTDTYDFIFACSM